MTTSATVLSDESHDLTAIETFSGAGGLSLGLLQAGFDIRLAFDIDTTAIRTYRHNIAPHGRVLDAREVSGAVLLEAADLNGRRLDLLSGGPPCQGFSKQRRGAHMLADPRNSLVLDFARLVKETDARAFVFENVEIFGQKRGAELIAELRDLLHEYAIYTFFVCASDFGLAQRRGRFVMIGIDRSEGDAIPVLEHATHQRTIRDVIGHLPPPPADCSEHPAIPNHIKCRITAENERRIAHVPPGGGWRDIPMPLRLPCHQVVDVQSGGWPDVYGRLEWDGQCPTLTAGFDSFSRGRYAHPEEHRSITLHEGALLQGFPDDFRFFGTRHDIRLQIGNAVAPPVGKAIGDAVRRILQRSNAIPADAQWPEETGDVRDRLALAV